MFVRALLSVALSLLVLFFAGSGFAESETSLTTKIENSYREMVASNDSAKAVSAHPKDQSLSILTVNLGLLTGQLAYVPHYDERRKSFVKTLRNFIRTRNVDVLFIQELWYKVDFIEANKMAKEEGFQLAIPDSEYSAKVSKYGMQIWVRTSALRPGTKLANLKVTNFTQSTRLEYIGGYKRALISAEGILANGQPVILANTHLSATVGANDIRLKQVNEAASLLAKMSANKQFIVFGADFNVSPEFEEALKDEVTQWEENRAPYVRFYEDTHLMDIFKALHPKDPGYTWDKRSNTNISDGPSAVKDEPLQRVDFIWAGQPNSSAPEKNVVLAEECELVFTEKSIPAGAAEVHLTDHFGLFAKIKVLGR